MVIVEFINVNGQCFKIPENLIKILPETIALFTTSQYIHCIDDWIKQLNKSGIKVELLKPKHCFRKGQILGCSIEKLETKANKFLVISTGLFHAKALLLNNKKSVIVLNPYTKKFTVLSPDSIKQLRLWKKANLKAFLHSKRIGIIITTKPGQRLMQTNLNEIRKLKQQFKDKKFYMFLADTITPRELENFPNIECWLNTACPRIIEDFYEDVELRQKFRIINMDDLKSINFT